MAATTSFINSMLTSGFTGTITMKLFTVGLPSTTGVEVSGGGYTAQTLALGTATAKRISTLANIVFTNLPTTPIVAFGIYKAGVLIDEALLNPSYTADVTSNELSISYYFDLSGS